MLVQEVLHSVILSLRLKVAHFANPDGFAVGHLLADHKLKHTFASGPIFSALHHAPVRTSTAALAVVVAVVVTVVLEVVGLVAVVDVRSSLRTGSGQVHSLDARGTRLRVALDVDGLDVLGVGTGPSDLLHSRGRSLTGLTPFDSTR